jgi:signal transduction histidine kinase
MSAMIEGVLAYSTVSIKEHPFERVNLNKLMEGVENDLELAMIQKEAQIHYSNLPQVSGIPLLLHQLFYNLINNSLKFSNPDVRPIITITSEGAQIDKAEAQYDRGVSYVHIKIQDNGIGFNQAYAEQMFGVFSRLHPKDRYDGTGLGLALCKKIVQRHGGAIWAEGEEGMGACFHVQLPT